MTGEQFPRDPFLDSPEETAYSGAPRDIVWRVRATNDRSAAGLKHSSFLPVFGSGGRKAILWIFPFRATTSPPAAEGQDVGSVPLLPFCLFMGKGQVPAEGQVAVPCWHDMPFLAFSLETSKILVKNKQHGVRILDRESGVLLSALPLRLWP